MFLTRFDINPRRRGAAKLLTSPHAMHAAVESGFPPSPPGEQGRVLWRLDADGDRATLYIASPRRPDLTHLVEQAGWPTTQSWLTRDYQPLLSRISVGQTWAFRLTANPVRNIRSEGATRGKPVGHVTAAQQEQWLLDRSEVAGFEIPTTADKSPAVAITKRDTLKFRRGESTVTLRIARFDGVLRVTDRERFVGTLINGLGRAKGYGCGLITLASPPE
ncbi:type I-E CRISPR-associated protein Cas6/Cse3/CasE [Saxibacter everestensis]|uniref:Type I-E CRISPR-associated protein Cas6/Cse3/CasE n=1 Tax=Saxibacter everestensis TaxID=2909229 RepID=A0ABY8QSA0_9MICO|nr:type I-E CRISPR-associated protein Cas6/Cse3/CasE [Brevibacteriaceae bacterium ZFBP1038]